MWTDNFGDMFEWMYLRTISKHNILEMFMCTEESTVPKQYQYWFFLKTPNSSVTIKLSNVYCNYEYRVTCLTPTSKLCKI